MTNAHALQSVEELTKPGGALDIGRDPARLLVLLIRLLAQRGGPLPNQEADRALIELGIDQQTARQLIARWTERNSDGDIVGFGVTYSPTPHRMTVGDAQMWAWCAMDTLIFAIVLDQQVAVESRSPGSGEIVRLRVDPHGILEAEPADAVVTFPARSNDQVDMSSTTAIWGTFCHHSFFFPSRAHAEQWAAGRTDVEMLPLGEGFEIAEQLAAGFLRYET
jgi:alkylmercury lyase